MAFLIFFFLMIFVYESVLFGAFISSLLELSGKPRLPNFLQPNPETKEPELWANKKGFGVGVGS